MEITWLGHSGFQLRTQTGETLLLDPWLANPKFPKDFTLQRADTVLLSHGHGDHSGSILDLDRQFSPTLVAIYELATYFGNQGVKKVIGMNKGGTAHVGSFKVSMTHAMHSSSIIQDDGTIIYAGEPAGFVITLPDGRRIYYAGDTTVFGDMRLIAELHHPDLAILPIGDLYTMGPKEAAFACNLLAVKRVIPMHWGTFPALTGTPAALRDLLKDAVEVIPLEPGVPFSY
ncbi:MAG: metal-dependent hydrolase [Bryobacterales bacterium]|nr:metal-dependent hydrolase [Bryobacterales bacterium]